MTFDEQVRQVLDGVADRVRDDLGRHLDVAATDLSRALESTQRSAIEAALVEARADSSRELEDACTNARREVEERLTGTFETERAAAIAQAALDATAAAESAAAERFAAVERNANDRLTEVEQAVTERLMAGFHVERESLRAERDAAADVAVSQAIAATECTVTERLSATFNSEREAIGLAAQEAWAKAEREHVERAQADLQASVRLLAVIQKIDEGDSLSEILGTLANGAAVEAARAGVFVVEGNGLRSWRLAGFGDLGREGVIRPSESNGGIIVDAMRTATVVHETKQVETADFGGAGRSAIAVPLAIAGRVIAVLYADQGQAGQAGQAAHAGRPNWASAIEILGRHAGRALEALTAARLAEAATSIRATAGPNSLRSAVR